MAKLREKFIEETRPALKDELKASSIEATPRVKKVVVSTGLGEYKEDKGKIEYITSDLEKIVGQKPKVNLSKMAVSAFKLRPGQPVGLTVTLRGEKMYDFINRLVNTGLPRVRDFKGLKKTALDGMGNFSIGIKDHTIMPEIKHEEVDFPFGFQVNINTTAKNDKEALLLLEKLGFPFSKEDNNRK